MQLEINKDEQQQLMVCIEATIKNSANSLQAASVLMPLAQKIQALTETKEGE